MGKRRKKKGGDAVEKDGGKQWEASRKEWIQEEIQSESKVGPNAEVGAAATVKPRQSCFAGAAQVLLCLAIVVALIAAWFAIGGTGSTEASPGDPEWAKQTQAQDTCAQATVGESRLAEEEKEVKIDAAAMETPKAETKEEPASAKAARQDAERRRLAEEEAAASLWEEQVDAERRRLAEEEAASLWEEQVAKAAQEEAERQRLGREEAVARQRAEEERERLKTQEQEHERALRQRMLEVEEELKKKAAEYRAWYLLEEEKARRVEEEAELAAAQGALEEAKRQRLAEEPVGEAEESEDTPTVRALLPLLDKLTAAQVREQELDDAIVRAHTVTAVCLFIFCALTPWMQPAHAASVQSK